MRWLIFVPRKPTRDRVGHYLPDLVYGANDGIITTFAVVSGVVGADLSRTIILILGFANLFADGISMGASNYLARRSHAEPTERATRKEAFRHACAIADLLLVGRRGLHGISALGSVSERVAHKAGCSVLVVREKEARQD